MKSPLRTVAEHQEVVAGLLGVGVPKSRQLADAVGLILGEDCHAGADLPGFDNSAMDGYAVRSIDVLGATRSRPIRLPVAGDVPAGPGRPPRLEPGTAYRIMTGAPMPDGADAVVQVEATDRGVETVAVQEERAVGVHVRSAGSDVEMGALVLSAGTVLGPAQVALLAALGRSSVQVIPPLRVLVLSTGSELVEPGGQLGPGQIHDANSVMLEAAVRGAGAHCVRARFVADDVPSFLETLRSSAVEVDLVLTSGGVSEGSYEVVKDALSGRGVEFVKVAVQPGMPQGVGMFEGVPVVMLPGNPVSALVSFEVFVRPALRAAMGLTQIQRAVVRAELTEPLDSISGKRQFRRGIVDLESGRVLPWGPAGSHFLRWFAQANCLIDVPSGVTKLAAGEIVDVWDLGSR
jgi:molybdopterin molybdotransferase